MSNNAATNPSHYKIFPDGMEVIDIIKRSLTHEEFIGYCKGNMLKYKLRAGHKGDAQTDLDKSEVYRAFFVEALNDKDTWPR